MSISIRIETPGFTYLGSAYADDMPRAITEAIRKAKMLVSAQRPVLHLRDVLGGLRAEVTYHDGRTTVRRT